MSALDSLKHTLVRARDEIAHLVHLQPFEEAAAAAADIAKVLESHGLGSGPIEAAATIVQEVLQLLAGHVTGAQLVPADTVPEPEAPVEPEAPEPEAPAPEAPAPEGDGGSTPAPKASAGAKTTKAAS